VLEPTQGVDSGSEILGATSGEVLGRMRAEGREAREHMNIFAATEKESGQEPDRLDSD
jgi:hypothetical protein